MKNKENEYSNIKQNPVELGMLVGTVIDQIRNDKALSFFMKKDSAIITNIEKQALITYNLINDNSGKTNEDETKRILKKASGQILKIVEELSDLSETHNFCSGIKN